MAGNRSSYDPFGFLSSPLHIIDDYQPETSPSLWSSLSEDFGEPFSSVHTSLYAPTSRLSTNDSCCSQGDLPSRNLQPHIQSPSNVIPLDTRHYYPSNSQSNHRRPPVVPSISALLSDPEVPSPTHSPFSPRTRDSSVVDLTETIANEMAPATRKRKAADSSPGSDKNGKDSVTLKKPRASSEGKTSVHQEKHIEELDLITVDDDEKYAEYRSRHQVDLINQQQQDGGRKAVRLASFQCIICLDNPTDLTVTHCGHMFCSICLHEALHAGTQKRACPVCRTAIGTVKSEGKQPKNGFYALEMKLMTSKRKGKQPLRGR